MHEQLSSALRATMAQGRPLFTRTVIDERDDLPIPVVEGLGFKQLAELFLLHFRHYQKIDLPISHNGGAVEDLYYSAAEAMYLISTTGAAEADKLLIEDLVYATERIISNSILNNFIQGLERSIRDRNPEPPEEILMDTPDPVDDEMKAQA